MDLWQQGAVAAILCPRPSCVAEGTGASVEECSGDAGGLAYAGRQLALSVELDSHWYHDVLVMVSPFTTELANTSFPIMLLFTVLSGILLVVLKALLARVLRCGSVKHG